MLTQDCLRRLWPRAPGSTVSAIARVAENVFASTGINTPLRQAHFLAQISHECGAGTIVPAPHSWLICARKCACRSGVLMPVEANTFSAVLAIAATVEAGARGHSRRKQSCVSIGAVLVMCES